SFAVDAEQAGQLVGAVQPSNLPSVDQAEPEALQLHLDGGFRPREAMLAEDPRQAAEGLVRVLAQQLQLGVGPGAFLEARADQPQLARTLADPPARPPDALGELDHGAALRLALVDRPNTGIDERVLRPVLPDLHHARRAQLHFGRLLVHRPAGALRQQRLATIQAGNRVVLAHHREILGCPEIARHLVVRRRARAWIAGAPDGAVVSRVHQRLGVAVVAAGSHLRAADPGVKGAVAPGDFGLCGHQAALLNSAGWKPKIFQVPGFTAIGFTCRERISEMAPWHVMKP